MAIPSQVPPTLPSYLPSQVGCRIMSDQQWSLAPLHGVLACARPGFMLAGPLGRPGFPSWLGKNSTMTKRARLLREFGGHMQAPCPLPLAPCPLPLAPCPVPCAPCPLTPPYAPCHGSAGSARAWRRGSTSQRQRPFLLT